MLEMLENVRRSVFFFPKKWVFHKIIKKKKPFSQQLQLNVAQVKKISRELGITSEIVREESIKSCSPVTVSVASLW